MLFILSKFYGSLTRGHNRLEVGSFCGFFAFVNATQCIFTAHIKITNCQLRSLLENSLYNGGQKIFVQRQTALTPNFDLNMYVCESFSAAFA